MLELIVRIFDILLSGWSESASKKDGSQYWTSSPLDEQRKQRANDQKSDKGGN